MSAGCLGGRVDGPEQVKERSASRNVGWVGVSAVVTLSFFGRTNG